MTEIELLTQISEYLEGIFYALGILVYVAGFLVAYLITKNI